MKQVILVIISTYMMVTSSNANAEIKHIASGKCNSNIIDNNSYLYYDLNGYVSGWRGGVDKKITTGVENQKPYMDIRYTQHVQKLVAYANKFKYTGIYEGSSSQSAPYTPIAWGTQASIHDPSGSGAQIKCADSYIAFGGMINGWDSYDVPTSYFGGPQATYTYLYFDDANPANVKTSPRPWTANINSSLVIQGYFRTPFHYSSTPNVGGAELNYNLFISNIKDPKKNINYVINIFKSNGAVVESFGRDPSTGSIFVSTSIDGNKYVTKSPWSVGQSHMGGEHGGIEEWPTFARVNISSKNLRTILEDAYGSPQAPSEWALTSAAVQAEITGSHTQSMGFSGRAFELYSNDNPL